MIRPSPFPAACGVALLLFLLPLRALSADEAKQVFDSLFAAKIKTVTTTADRADDLALAKEILAIAKTSTNQSGLLTLLCDTTHDLSAKHPEGFSTAIESQQLLAEHVEEKRNAAREKLIILLTKQSTAGKPEEREAAGEALIDLLTTMGDEKIEKKQYTEATGDYRRAVTVATQKKSASLEDVKAKLEFATARDRGVKNLARLQEKLLKDANDSATAEEIVKIYVIEFDDPASAVPYLNRVKDEQLKKMVVLAAMGVLKADGDASLAIGEWYLSLSQSGGSANTRAMLTRAMACLKHSRDQLNQGALARTKADGLLKDVESKLKTIGGKNAATLTNSVRMKFVRVAGGEFMMGEVGTAKRMVIANEFYIGLTEVTQGQWKAVMETEPWKGKENVKEGDAFPASYITWDDALEFCIRIGKKEKRTYRLPLEMEWEYACRAGTSTGWSFGNNVRDLDDHGWHRGNAENKGEKFPHRVATKKANPWGLFDMHGNVWEWCQEDFSDGRKVIRGGAWSFDAEPWSRSAYQASNPRGFPNFYIGFRVILVP